MDISKGYPKAVIVNIGERIAPSMNKGWLILSGVILHVTATPTLVYIMSPTNNAIFKNAVPSASVSAEYPLFSTLAGDTQAQYSPIIIDGSFNIIVTGDTGALVRLLVIEFPM
jgi:hypothetical protein